MRNVKLNFTFISKKSSLFYIYAKTSGISHFLCVRLNIASIATDVILKLTKLKTPYED